MIIIKLLFHSLLYSNNLLSWGNTFPWLKHQHFQDNGYSLQQSFLDNNKRIKKKKEKKDKK
jgi:hypothetical protein